MITAFGYIKDGKMKLSNRKRFEQDISQQKNGDIEIIIRRRNRRSSPANRYYWGIVIKEIEIRLKELGNDCDSETIHEFLKDKFNKKEIIGDGGEIIGHIGGTTTKMNKSEFGDYLSNIILWCAEFLQITIPEPNSKNEINFYE